MKGSMLQRGSARELSVYLGGDPVSGKQPRDPAARPGAGRPARREPGRGGVTAKGAAARQSAADASAARTASEGD